MAPHSYDNGSDSLHALPAPSPWGLVDILWRRRLVLALGALAGIGLAGVYHFVTTPVYASTAQVLVVKKRPQTTLTPEGATPAVDEFLSTQITLIKSPLVADRAAEKGNLCSLRCFAKEKDELSEGILKKLSVTRARDLAGGTSSVITLSFRASEPEEGNVVLRAIIDAYFATLQEGHRKSGEAVVELIAQAQKEAQDELTRKETAYSAFRRSAPLLWKGKEWVNARQERLGIIETKRTATTVRRTEVQGQVTALETAIKDGRNRESLLSLVALLSTKPTSDVGVYKDKQTALQDQLHPLLMQEQKLMQIYGPEHPEVVAVRNRIATTRALHTGPAAAWDKKAEATDPVQGYLQYLRQDLEQLQTSEKLLTQLVDQERAEVKKMSDFEVEDETYRNTIAHLQIQQDTSAKQLKEANLANKAGGYETTVVAAPGSTAVKKVEPNLLLSLSLAGLLSILGGFGLVGATEFLDRRLRSPDEVRRRLRLPIVGEVPHLIGRRPRRPALGLPILAADLCSYHRPMSPEAEAFRGLRTALSFSGRGRDQQVIQITAPDSGDGATTMAANLAVSMAQAGKRVLLIDANFHSPRLHEIFGLSSEVGLSSVLTGEATPQEAAQPTAIPGLALMAAGPLPAAPSELLSSPRFEELLAELREHCDFILVDTPPLLAVTDPCAVAARVDGVLLTVRVSHSAREEAERARELLATVGAPVLGVVVNGVSSQDGYRGRLMPMNGHVNGG